MLDVGRGSDSHAEICVLFSNILLYPECWVYPKNLHFPKFLGQCCAHKDLVIALLDGNSGWNLGAGVLPQPGESVDMSLHPCLGFQERESLLTLPKVIVHLVDL